MVTKDELQRRVMARVMLPAGTPQPVGFLLEIVISSVLAFLVQRCLSRLWPELAERPGRIALWRLDRAIRSACAAAARSPYARALGIDAASLYRDHGARVRAAILATAREAPAQDWAAFRAANASD